MLRKQLEVDVESSTWPPGHSMPASLVTTSTPELVDLKAALLLLGTLTTPGGHSRASPARHWAWVRYFHAVAPSPDLRVTGPYADLDPHQVGVLSDNFGVAIPTLWFVDRLGGYREIVDGRLFALKYGALIHSQPKSIPKVGPTKSPDFVIRATDGKWHVLECKGTQTSKAYRDRQLEGGLDHPGGARAQKRSIRIVPALRGERLAAGLLLAREDDAKKASHLRVIDPPAASIVVVSERYHSEAIEAAQQIMLARCLALFGMYELGDEIVLPADLGALPKLLKKSEVRRLRAPPDVRQAQLVAQHSRMLAVTRPEKRDGAGSKRVLESEFDLSDVDQREPRRFQRLRAEYKIDAELISEIDDMLKRPRRPRDTADGVVNRARPLLDDAKVSVVSDEGSAEVRYGNLLEARIELS